MKASIVPFEVASNASKALTIWSAAKTSIWNRPPLVCSTALASRWAEPWSTLRAGGHAVESRHLILGCAITAGASTATAPTASAPAFARNRRRLVSRGIIRGSPGHALVIGALGDVVPGPDQKLELRERGVHLPGLGTLGRLVADHLRRQLLEVAQHGHRQLEDLDGTLELRPQALQRKAVLRPVLHLPVDLRHRGGVVERVPQVRRQRIVCLAVEAEVVRGARLVPARVVV